MRIFLPRCPQEHSDTLGEFVRTVLPGCPQEHSDTLGESVRTVLPGCPQEHSDTLGESVRTVLPGCPQEHSDTLGESVRTVLPGCPQEHSDTLGESARTVLPGCPQEHSDTMDEFVRTVLPGCPQEHSDTMDEFVRTVLPGCPQEHSDTMDEFAIAGTLCLHRGVVRLHLEHRDVDRTDDKVTVVQDYVELCLGPTIGHALDVNVRTSCRWERELLCVVLQTVGEKQSRHWHSTPPLQVQTSGRQCPENKIDAKITQFLITVRRLFIHRVHHCLQPGSQWFC